VIYKARQHLKLQNLDSMRPAAVTHMGKVFLQLQRDTPFMGNIVERRISITVGQLCPILRPQSQRVISKWMVDIYVKQLIRDVTLAATIWDKPFRYKMDGIFGDGILGRTYRNNFKNELVSTNLHRRWNSIRKFLKSSVTNCLRPQISSSSYVGML
jgi:hypothetical protein